MPYKFKIVRISRSSKVEHLPDHITTEFRMEHSFTYRNCLACPNTSVLLQLLFFCLWWTQISYPTHCIPSFISANCSPGSCFKTGTWKNWREAYGATLFTLATCWRFSRLKSEVSRGKLSYFLRPCIRTRVKWVYLMVNSYFHLVFYLVIQWVHFVHCRKIT